MMHEMRMLWDVARILKVEELLGWMLRVPNSREMYRGVRGMPPGNFETPNFLL